MSPSVTFSMPLSKDDKDTWIGFATGAAGAGALGALGAGQSADWLAVEIKGKKMKYTRKGSEQVEVEVTEDGDKKYKFTGGTATVTGENPFASSMALIIGLSVGGGVLFLIIVLFAIFVAKQRAARSDFVPSSYPGSAGFDSRF